MTDKLTVKEELVWCVLTRQWSSKYVCRYCIHYENGNCKYMRMKK